MYAYAPRPTPLTAIRSRRPVAGWRVTTRRALLLLAAFVLTVVFTAQVARGSEVGGYVQTTVRPGDTVWSIAEARYPGADTRQRVDQILRANGLKSPVLYPGEHLQVPGA